VSRKAFIASVAILLLGYGAFGADRRVDATFAYSTNLDARGAHSLAIRGDAVTVDGRALTGPELLSKRIWLTRALAVGKPGPASTCPAGSFTHRVVEDGKERSQHGCLGDRDFGELREAFRRLAAPVGVSG
jgi:hypothetical protein